MRFSVALVAAALALAAAGCADFGRGPAPPAPVDGGNPDRARSSGQLVADSTFEISVYPILFDRCEGCHKRGRLGGDTRLVLTGLGREDREAVLNLVVPGDPANSPLLSKGTGESHTGGSLLSVESDQYQTISAWISGLGTSGSTSP